MFTLICSCRTRSKNIQYPDPQLPRGLKGQHVGYHVVWPFNQCFLSFFKHGAQSLIVSQFEGESCRDTFVMGKSDMSKCPIIKGIYNRVYTIVIEVLDLI